MRKEIFCLLLAFTFFPVSAQIEKRRFDGTTSLIEVIANGKEYDLKEVSLKGYFVDGQRRGRLYLQKDDADYYISGNSIVIEYDMIEGDLELLRSMSNKYIRIDGTFYNGLGRLEVGLGNLTYFATLEKRGEE